MKAILVGYGEIGRGVYEVFVKHHSVFVHDPYKGLSDTGSGYDILLVAIPYTDTFVESVQEYAFKFSPKATLIFSTVPVGTCSKLGACHCPVEGKHPHLEESIRLTDKWLGGESFICHTFLSEAGFNVKQLPKPEFTEFLKLRSTTLYGVNIEFARYSKEVCDSLGMDYNEVKEWDRWVNKLYNDMGMPQYTRYILEPPVGPKGGHCVTPNAKLLNRQYPNKLVHIVSED